MAEAPAVASVAPEQEMEGVLLQSLAVVVASAAPEQEGLEIEWVLLWSLAAGVASAHVFNWVQVGT